MSLALNGELNHNGEPPTRRLSERKPLTLNPLRCRAFNTSSLGPQPPSVGRLSNGRSCALLRARYTFLPGGLRDGVNGAEMSCFSCRTTQSHRESCENLCLCPPHISHNQSGETRIRS